MMGLFSKYGRFRARSDRDGMGGGTPSYTPPPAPPPAAAPATLASSSIAQSQASRSNITAASMQDIGTSPQGIDSKSVTTGKGTLGGVN